MLKSFTLASSFIRGSVTIEFQVKLRGRFERIPI